MDKNSKIRSFHLLVSKAILNNDENYVFIFANQGTQNPNNTFAIAIIKSPYKNIPIQAILIQISKGEAYQKRP